MHIGESKNVLHIYIIHVSHHLDSNSIGMAGWCVQFFVALFVPFFARLSSAYQLDQFYSYNQTDDQEVVGSVSSPVKLNTTFQFKQGAKSYISVSRIRLWMYSNI